MPDRSVLRTEFERAARYFSARTAGRFDRLDVVSFSRARPGAGVLEVGAGTGSFLSLFEGTAGRLVGIDLTAAMLHEARSRHPALGLVVADGAALPFPGDSFDLVTSAQTVHHIAEPVPVLKEMSRVAGKGAVLVVDQVATENYEEIAFNDELERIRDPSHAASRPPSAYRIMVQASGLSIVDEKIVTDEQRLSKWMWPEEFPAERIERVRDFISSHGDKTGMNFRRDGDDFVFTRRRMMLLARRAA